MPCFHVLPELQPWSLPHHAADEEMSKEPRLPLSITKSRSSALTTAQYDNTTKWATIQPSTRLFGLIGNELQAQWSPTAGSDTLFGRQDDQDLMLR